MKVELTVPEEIEIFNEIQKKPEALFEMIRLDLQQTVGEALRTMLSLMFGYQLSKFSTWKMMKKLTKQAGTF
ncbi:hypothetical protein SAMN05660330_03930 [Desulforhopalus singaporensis]|uniref:Uncharacterized protein n=1 Tax=Desulforhopalus singaporensis TaxID=91360 RepID=A0A1H0V8Q2_9BACT|nr:hypothetical protein [Desulforhopalus singaporensis]SDP74767.1 hypothetical protein SAMN05660330_03930 [Desulforhopalus singaporensis]